MFTNLFFVCYLSLFPILYSSRLASFVDILTNALQEFGLKPKPRGCKIKTFYAYARTYKEKR